MFADELRDLAVKLIAPLRAKLFRGHLVVFDHGLVLGGQPFHRHLFGAVLVFVDKHEPAAERFGSGRRAVILAPGVVIDLEILLHRLPRLLGNDQ